MGSLSLSFCVRMGWAGTFFSIFCEGCVGILAILAMGVTVSWRRGIFLADVFSLQVGSWSSSRKVSVISIFYAESSLRLVLLSCMPRYLFLISSTIRCFYVICLAFSYSRCFSAWRARTSRRSYSTSRPFTPLWLRSELETFRASDDEDGSLSAEVICGRYFSSDFRMGLGRCGCTLDVS